MCLANPAQVVEVEEHAVLVRYGREASARLAEVELSADLKVRPGDWVLVHAGRVLGTVDPEEGEFLADLYREITWG
ncbi:MAG TPA: HypC/HybG/HupF family hydrogenase formation chaperone [Anaerolineales bacterium]|nr:HypC/HybG/HupF family hydrogenase formation chaperone [Anaerolineales bacterium]